MSDYILSRSSTVDLTPMQMKTRGIRYICFHFMLDGQEHDDDMGETILAEELYARMTDGAETKTSQVTVAEYTEYFEQLLQEKKDILHVEFSSGLSGSYNSARLAVEELREKYPDRKIYLLDSLGASSGYGLIMETLADLRDSGKSAEEVYQWVEENKLRMHHWFFSTDLSFYIKGGRISKTAGTVGSILGICPLLNMDDQGRLKPREKIRTKKEGDPQDRGNDGGPCTGRTGIQGKVLYLPFGLSGGRQDRGFTCGRKISADAGKGRNLSYWCDDRESYRSGNGSAVFLGRLPGRLVRKGGI